MISSFSVQQNYNLYQYPTEIRSPGYLSTWEKETLSFISQVGAAAYFQVAPKGRQRNQIDRLCRAGLCFKYQLQGERKINVAASKFFNNTKELLKTLAFTQLIKKLSVPLEVTPGEGIIHAVIHMYNQSFPVIVLRHGDAVSLLPFVTRGYNRLIIISEEYHPEFDKITVPVRIALDNVLLSDDFYFLCPGGKQERIKEEKPIEQHVPI